MVQEVIYNRVSVFKNSPVYRKIEKGEGPRCKNVHIMNAFTSNCR